MSEHTPEQAYCADCGYKGNAESFPIKNHNGGDWETCPECGSMSVRLIKAGDTRGYYTRSYDAGYDAGYHEGYESALEESAIDLRAIFERRSFNVLEDLRVRWDAALKVWVLSQDGREYLLREES